MKETWFLLFGGDSVDGMGSPKYIGRTTDPLVAKKHFRQIKKNPYSTGKVIICDDSKHVGVFRLEDIK